MSISPYQHSKEAADREEEGRTDAERLDWLERSRAVVWPPTEQSKRWAALPVPYGSNNGDGGGATLREAIDAAMDATHD